MPTILGVNFGRDFLGGLEAWRNKAEHLRTKNLLEKFAEKFPGNFS